MTPPPAATAEMKITAIAPWFGSKRTLAPVIVEEIGKPRCWWEVFCASLAVTFAKEPSQFETVNDLHGDLINLARVLRDGDTAAELYGELARALMCEDLFRESAALCEARKNNPPPEFPDVEAARDFFFMSWMGISGLLGTKGYTGRYARRYTSNGGHAGKRFCSAVESIPAWHQRLSQVTILSTDAIALCERIEDKAGTVIYADPPYLKKGDEYVHDFDWLAHRRLATVLNRFKKTRVVVSYYAHPDLAAMYPGWTVRDVSITKSIVNQGRRDGNGATVAPEVLLLNGPSFVAAASRPDTGSKDAKGERGAKGEQ